MSFQLSHPLLNSRRRPHLVRGDVGNILTVDKCISAVTARFAQVRPRTHQLEGASCRL
jgi:hypothetical protein